MTDDPLRLFARDRQRAWDAQDPMAALCTVANVDADGAVQQRTLVLRDVDGSLAIFINATSPKWPAAQAVLSVHTYWPSVQVQYRLAVRTEPVDEQVVKDSWLLRPDAPKRMDWYYEQVATQSSAVASRDGLLAGLAGLTLPEPLVAPDNARGLILVPEQIERLDLTQENGVHDRVRYELGPQGWQAETLVP